MRPAKNLKRPMKGCGDREGAKGLPAGGRGRVDHWGRRIDLDSLFTVMQESGGGSGGGTVRVGTRRGLRRGREEQQIGRAHV